MAGQVIGQKAANEGGVNKQNYDEEGKFAKKYSSKGRGVLLESKYAQPYREYSGGVFTDTSKPARSDFPDTISFLKAMKEYKDGHGELMEAVKSSDIGDEAASLSVSDISSIIDEANAWERKIQPATDANQAMDNLVKIATFEFVDKVASKLTGNLSESGSWAMDCLAEELFGQKRLNSISKEEFDELGLEDKVIIGLDDIGTERWHLTYRGLSNIKHKDIQKTLQGYTTDDEKNTRSIYGTGGFGRAVYMTTDKELAINGYGDSVVMRSAVNVGEAKLVDSMEWYNGIFPSVAFSLYNNKDNIKKRMTDSGCNEKSVDALLDYISRDQESAMGFIAGICGYDGIVGEISGTENQITMINPRMVYMIPENYVDPTSKTVER